MSVQVLIKNLENLIENLERILVSKNSEKDLIINNLKRTIRNHEHEIKKLKKFRSEIFHVYGRDNFSDSDCSDSE